MVAWGTVSLLLALLVVIHAIHDTRHRLHIDRELTDLREEIQRLRAELDAALEPDQQ